MKLDKNKEKNLVILLRFGPPIGRNILLRWLTYDQIGRYINRSSTYVRKICLEYAAPFLEKYSIDAAFRPIDAQLQKLKFSSRLISKKKE